MGWVERIAGEHSIRRQALLRLVLSMGVLVLLLGVSTALIYERALQNAEKEQRTQIARFYLARMAQWEYELELHTRDVRIRIEHERALETPETASLRLQALLTIQGHSRRFSHLVIVDKSGQALFTFGKYDEEIPGDWPHVGVAPPDWHLARASGRLYRVQVEPVWLGASGGTHGNMGWMLAFYPIDNRLMGQLALPEVDVFAAFRQTQVAASRERHVAGVQPLWLDWNGVIGSPVRLQIDTRFQPLFSSRELILGVAVVPLLDVLLLWLALGGWLLKQMYRVRALGLAVAEGTQVRGDATVLQAHLQIARNHSHDEIHGVAEALDSMWQQQHRHEEKIEKALGMFQAVVEGTPVAMVLIDQQGRIVLVNGATERLFGRTRASLTGDSVESLLPVRLRELHVRERDGFFSASTNRSMGVGREVSALLADGSEREVEVGLTPIDSPDGHLALASIVDISSYKRTQAIIGTALREKTTLLDEVHHRVKNNLQVIASLLNLQAGQVGDPGYERLLGESVQRVRVMALVHQLLYEGQEFSRINLGEYLTRLAHLLADLNDARRRGIAVRVEADDLDLDLSRAIPCGLIVNEILSNSFKHAFTENGGEIRLVLLREPEGEALIRVTDNGRGLPAHFDPEAASGLGMQLIYSLAGQMGAGVSVTAEGGTCYELRFTPMADLSS